MLVKIDCCGEKHRVILSRRGRIALLDHGDVNIDAELAAGKLGGKLPPCVGVIRDFRDMEKFTPTLREPLEEASQRRWLRFMAHQPDGVEWAGGNHLASVLEKRMKACSFHCVLQPIDVRWSWTWTVQRIGDHGVIKDGDFHTLVIDADYRDGGWLLVITPNPTETTFDVRWRRAGKYVVPEGMTIAPYVWLNGTWDNRREGGEAHHYRRTIDIGEMYKKAYPGLTR